MRLAAAADGNAMTTIAQPTAGPASLSRTRRPESLWSRWRKILHGRIETPQSAEFAARIVEASQLWATHIDTAQVQVRDATQALLEGFGQILSELDQIVAPSGDASASEVDTRAAVLTRCEERLRGLLERLQGFVQSRDRVLNSVRSLSAASGSLGGMAEDVGKLARQTSLLSINAAIEAARAGQSGRGFAVVAGEVRRLSAESGQTGKRISDQVQDFGGRMREVLAEADQHALRDASAVHASEQTVNEVIASVDSAVSQLNQRALELCARGESVKAQVEQLMVAFQFQDRVCQILEQVRDSMGKASGRLQSALADGHVPDAQEWMSLLSAGYTTREQRSVVAARGVFSAALRKPLSATVATVAGAAQETTFF